MAEFTLLNIKNDVEDQAPKWDLSPDLEARFATRALELAESGFSYQRMAPNVRSSFGHRHEKQEELYVIVGGGGRAKIGDAIVDLQRWDAVRVPATEQRAFEAGDDGLELLAYGAPYDPGEVTDMTPGWWSD